MKKSKIEKLRIHKQHLFIKAVAWLTILTFFITLLFLGFPIISQASDSYKFSDYYYTSDFLTNEGASGLDKYIDGQFVDSSFVEQYKTNLIDIFNQSQLVVDPSDYYMYICTPSDFISSHEFKICLLFKRNNNRAGLQVGYRYDNINESIIHNFAFSASSYNFTYTYDLSENKLSYDGQTGFSWDKICYGSGPIYFGYNSINDCNYLYLSGDSGNGSGGFTGSDADSSILDNMFLYGGGVALSSNGCQDGTLYLAALPTKSQVSDGYKVRITADGNYTFRIENGYSYFLDGYDMVKKYGLSLDSNNSVNFNLRSNKGNYVEFPFSDFQHGLLTLDLNSDILSNCYTTGIDSNILDLSKYLFQNSNFWSKATQPISNYITQSKSVGIGDYTVTLPDYINSTADEPKLVITNCKVVYTMYIVSPDGNQTSDGSMVFISDMLDSSNSQIALDNLTKTPEEVADKTTTENYNKYEPEYPINVPQNITNPSAPSNSDSNSSSDSSNSNNVQISSGDNSPVFNNNVVLDSKPLPSGFINNLLTLIHGEKNTDIELLENTSGISGVMYLFEVSMSWIPPEVISIWTTFLKATLGICVGAFFLKILVNWST